MSNAVVVAVGARTPVGLRTDSTAAAVRAGLSNFAEYPFAMRSGQPVVVSADPLLDTAIEGAARLVLMAESALREVAEALGDDLTRLPGHVLLALPEPRPGLSDDDATRIARDIDDLLPGLGLSGRTSIAGRGHAGGAVALAKAHRALADGRGDLVIVLGADTYHHPESFMWLEAERRFAQPAIRGGFIPGEGVAALALLSDTAAARLGATPLAVVEAVGLGTETLLRASETGSFGQGMSAAVEAATRMLDLPQEAVDTVYADINGERYRSEEWGFMAMKLYRAFRSLEYEAPASSWGDVGAASATLFGILAVESFRRGYARGPRVLAMVGSDSGQRGAVLMSAP